MDASDVHKATELSTDGDIHASGDFPEAGFAPVAELMNANFNDEAVNALTAGGDIEMTGVWRLWCEHAEATKLFTQGSPVPIAAGNSNPNHVFEIHPIVSMNDDSFVGSVSTITSTLQIRNTRHMMR